MQRKPGTTRRRISPRLFVLLGLGGVLIAAGLFYVAFWHQRPMGSGPAGPVVGRAPFETIWSARPVELLGFGDSITDGLGSSQGHSYFARLLSNPEGDAADMRGLCLQHVLPQLTGTNAAVSGTDSLEHRDLLLKRIALRSDETFGIIVATIGGNDVIHMYGRTPPREGAMYGATLEQARPWIANFESRLNAILDELGSRFPGGHHVFLANIYDPTDGTGDIQHAGLPAWPEGLQVLAAYNEVIARTAGRRSDTTLVDIHREFLGHGIHCRQFWHRHYDSTDPHYWYFDNLEDPNDRGYDAIRRLFLIEMARVLPGRLAARDLPPTPLTTDY